jgi:hypothetical protein
MERVFGLCTFSIIFITFWRFRCALFENSFDLKFKIKKFYGGNEHQHVPYIGFLNMCPFPFILLFGPDSSLPFHIPCEKIE